MFNDVEVYVLLFFTYAIIGWFMEVCLQYIQYKRFINRGFLMGPYLPIYGCGGILITLFLKRYLNDPLALFIFGMLICTVLEYFTSFIMEKLFNARWWDYSNKKFNINGRVCLDTMIPFGLLGLLIMYVLNPFFLNIYSKINPIVLSVIFTALSVMFVIDCIISIIALIHVRNDGQLHDKDNTEEMSNKVKKLLSKWNFKEKRLVNAFPKADYIGSKVKKSVKYAKDKHDEIKDNHNKKK